jgi:hypothetical protein
MAALPADSPLPDKSPHWNYVTSVSRSPDNKLLLVGSEAGSSDSHFEDYWLYDRVSRTWKYAGGGNDAKWSPDSSTILWASPRELEPIGKIHVWVSHLILFDVATLKHQPLTQGISYESEFFWCMSGEPPMAQLRDRFQKAAAVTPKELIGRWVVIRNITTQKFINGREGPDHVEFESDGVRSRTERKDVPQSPQGEPLEWVSTFRMVPSGQVEVTSDASWLPTENKSPVTINANKEAVFTKAYGGDSAWIYRCRLAGPRNLLCLLRGHEDGHGIEFLRQSQ